MKRLTTEFKKRIESKISELEKHTSVEFVPAIARSSSNYREYRVIYGLGFLALALVSQLIRPDFSSETQIVLNSILGTVALQILFLFNPIFRVMIPKSSKLHAVADEAHRVFLHEEIFETKLRTGVLIFISEFERAVFILADKGLLAKVPSKEWADLGQVLARDFSKRSEGETFISALDVLAKRLSSEFPPVDGLGSELKNSVREVK